MKLNITREQIDEINGGQLELLFSRIGGTIVYEKIDEMIIQKRANLSTLPNIGQMIEFLGDGWDEDVKYQSMIMNLTDGGDLPMNDRLVDALWEAVKEKLENINKNENRKI